MHFGGLHEDEIAGKVYDRRLMGRFISYLAPYRGLIVATLLLLPLIAASKLAQPYLVKLAVDSHITPRRMEGLPLLAGGFLLLIVADSLFTFAQVYLLQLAGQKVMADMRMELFRKVQGLASSYFDRTPAGSTVTRLTNDVEVLGEMFAAGVVTIVGDVLLLAGIVGMMLWMNVKLSLVAFSVMPVLIVTVALFRRRMRQAFRGVRALLSRLNSFLAESIGGMSLIQLFNRQESERARFRELNEAYRDANLPVITWDAALYALVEALSSMAAGLIIWYGGGEIVRGNISFGALVAFIQYSEKFFAPIRDLSAKYSVMQGAMAALERIFALLDTEENIPSPEMIDPALERRLERVEEIRFEDVWFAYKPGEHVLKGFSLTVRQGEKVALVGETGGGKTTVTRLLSRLYDIERGRITINGIDIRDIPLPLLRLKIGVVLQEPYLFTGSIGYNISLGDPAAQARMGSAARVVGADRFIGRLKSGFDEEVRERGVNFSAGERQLLSFARAVAFDPEILILDEATSSVDSESERLIRQGLSGLLSGRTSLVVAHRLSTIEDADRIVVIHRGEKQEEGDHPSLMARQGVYYRLYQLQFRDADSLSEPPLSASA